MAAASAREFDPKSLKKPCRRLLKVKDAAYYLSLSSGKVRDLIRQGELPTVRFGETTWLIDISDLDELINRYKRFA